MPVAFDQRKVNIRQSTVTVTGFCIVLPVDFNG